MQKTGLIKCLIWTVVSNLLKRKARHKIQVSTSISVTNIADANKDLAKDWSPLMSNMDSRLEAMEKKVNAQEPINSAGKNKI